MQGHTRMSDVDSFLKFILIDNKTNLRIDVVFDFLKTPFDLFNFFVYLVIKSLSMLSGKTSIQVENINMTHIALIKDRFSYAGLQVNVDIIENEVGSYSRVYIHQDGEGDKIEMFSLNILMPTRRYKMGFKLVHTNIQTKYLTGPRG